MYKRKGKYYLYPGIDILQISSNIICSWDVGWIQWLYMTPIIPSATMGLYLCLGVTSFFGLTVVA